MVKAYMLRLAWGEAIEYSRLQKMSRSAAVSFRHFNSELCFDGYVPHGTLTLHAKREEYKSKCENWGEQLTVAFGDYPWDPSFMTELEIRHVQAQLSQNTPSTIPFFERIHFVSSGDAGSFLTTQAADTAAASVAARQGTVGLGSQMRGSPVLVTASPHATPVVCKTAAITSAFVWRRDMTLLVSFVVADQFEILGRTRGGMLLRASMMPTLTASGYGRNI